MNTTLLKLPAIPTADEMTLESALAARGWEQQVSGSWRLTTPRGDCLLIEVAHRDTWRQFELRGRATPQSTNRSVLEDNFRVFGPAKLVARSGKQPVCRLDVPEALAGFEGHAFGANGQLQMVNARAAWAMAVTACATGKYTIPDRVAELDESVADDLKQAGWSASLDNGHLHVHLQLPGIYRQLTVEQDACAGVKLATELIGLTGLERDSVCAIRHLAAVVNARVPLVRLADSGAAEALSLRAEVGFGATLIPGAFLAMALHAMETTVACCARELEALREPELARLVLAAAAARNSDV